MGLKLILVTLAMGKCKTHPWTTHLLAARTIELEKISRHCSGEHRRETDRKYVAGNKGRPLICKGVSSTFQRLGRGSSSNPRDVFHRSRIGSRNGGGSWKLKCTSYSWIFRLFRSIKSLFGKYINWFGAW